LVKRDRIDESLALKMLSQQLENDERISRAHDILDNRSETADLESQVARLNQLYLKLSAA
ncbi:MAG: dephospho-CoA kinase, partial [Gammaproteobacteria bacterium]|nr:dephospho-CoA kinase [Gammaproteobacteria bacterium]